MLQSTVVSDQNYTESEYRLDWSSRMNSALPEILKECGDGVERVKQQGYRSIVAINHKYHCEYNLLNTTI